MTGRIATGGRRFRLRLTNAYGNAPVSFAAVHAAIQQDGPTTESGSDRAVLFDGKPTVTLPPGVEWLSDPFEMPATALTHFAVSIFVQDEALPTMQTAALHTVSYLASGMGDLTSSANFQGATPSPAYYWLSGIDVAAPGDAYAIVAIGDSITDALGSPTADDDWPSILAARLHSNSRTHNAAVVNVGISGNRLLSDGAGISGLARVERDALRLPGIRWLLVLEGINDIGAASLLSGKPDAAAVIDAYRQIIEKAHAQRVRVAGCTILPYKGAFYYRESLSTVRQEVNRWIRSSGAFDAVVDFDAAMRDPSDPEQIRLELQRGDHLHPNSAGYRVMANVIDLGIFR